MVAATAEAGTGQRSSVPGRRDVPPPPTPGSWPLQVPLVLKTILVSPWGGRLRPRPRTCCCCGRRGDLRAVPAPPGRRSLPRAPGTAEGRRGSAGPAAGPPGTRGRAASGATPSAPSGLGEAAPAPRASSGAHPPPWQHFGSRISPNMSKSPLPGSVAGRDKGPEATAGPRAGAQDAQPRSAAAPAARRAPPAAPPLRPRRLLPWPPCPAPSPWLLSHKEPEMAVARGSLRTPDLQPPATKGPRWTHTFRL